MTGAQEPESMSTKQGRIAALAERFPQRAETFDFLGFTYYWGKSRRGRLIIKQKTAKDRYKRGLKRISLWCRATNRHRPLREQHRQLCRKVAGHYAYYGDHEQHRSSAALRKHGPAYLDQVAQEALAEGMVLVEKGSAAAVDSPVTKTLDCYVPWMKPNSSARCFCFW